MDKELDDELKISSQPLLATVIKVHGVNALNAISKFEIERVVFTVDGKRFDIVNPKEKVRWQVSDRPLIFEFRGMYLTFSKELPAGMFTDPSHDELAVLRLIEFDSDDRETLDGRRS